MPNLKSFVLIFRNNTGMQRVNEASDCCDGSIQFVIYICCYMLVARYVYEMSTVVLICNSYHFGELHAIVTFEPHNMLIQEQEKVWTSGPVIVVALRLETEPHGGGERMVPLKPNSQQDRARGQLRAAIARARAGSGRRRAAGGRRRPEASGTGRGRGHQAARGEAIHRARYWNATYRRREAALCKWARALCASSTSSSRWWLAPGLGEGGLLGSKGWLVGRAAGGKVAGGRGGGGRRWNFRVPSCWGWDGLHDCRT